MKVTHVLQGYGSYTGLGKDLRKENVLLYLCITEHEVIKCSYLKAMFAVNDCDNSCKNGICIKFSKFYAHATTNKHLFY